MEHWLRCTINPGMFEGEFGVEGKQYNGAVFSLFAPEETVDCGGRMPTEDAPVEGWVRVERIGQEKDLVLVQLPRPTFQDGSFVTVHADQLRVRSPRAQRVDCA